MPIIFSLFFGVAFDDSGEKPQVSLGVVNDDSGFLGRRLVHEIESEGFAISEITADEFVEDGPVARALFIPEGFTEQVVSGEVVKIVLKKFEDSNVNASAAAEANIFRAIIRIIGNLTLMEMSGPSDSTVTVEAAYDRSIPQERKVELEVVLAGSLTKIPSGFNHTVPGTVVMFVLMCVLIFGTQLIISEKKSGLLRRISVGPVTTAQILSGKLFSRVAAGVLQVIILFIVTKLLFGVYFGNSWAGLILLMAAYVLCVGGLSLLVGALVNSPEFASGLSILISLVMASLGGCWWPLEIVPSPARELAFVFPTGWAMDGLHKVMAFGYGLNAVLPNILVLTGMFVLLSCLAVKFMTRDLSGSAEAPGKPRS
jgi:ABC-type multidrug transport system permease subunit